MNASGLIQFFTALGVIITALGVITRLGSSFDARRMAKSQFEDTLVVQYRSIVCGIPLEALLGQPLCLDPRSTRLYGRPERP